MKKNAKTADRRPRVLARALAEELRDVSAGNYVIVTRDPSDGSKDITDWVHDDVPAN